MKRVSTVAILVLTISVCALAQEWSHRDKIFSGVINAYTPQTTSSTGVITGPYEVRGPWSLTLERNSTKADFSAALNMEFSDGWVLTHNTAAPANFDPTTRGAHTHHITLVDGEVTQIANGFQVTGPAVFTLNGGSAPVTVSPSQVVIQITGGSEVEFSNITLTFQSPGSNHFGTDPLPGVVRSVRDERSREPR
ncbi:MAG: hypothetical protein ACHP8A_04570 [Terriglobales bacterium]|jgi:hypothetical protein|nr:hypothetical protein [Terriglobales bacterium]